MISEETKYHMVSARVTDAELRRMDHLAKSTGRSRSGLLRWLLDSAQLTGTREVEVRPPQRSMT